MTDQSDVRSPGKRRRATLRVFYGFVSPPSLHSPWESVQVIHKE